jgi:hypothetical protein
MQDQAATPRRRLHHTIWWWTLTLVVLVVLDDLTFGPFFWVISRTAGPWWAVAAVYAVYVPVQIYLVRAGTRDHPGRLAQWFLQRLDLERRHPRIRENEHRIRSRVAGAGSAVALSLVIAGVLPPLLLWRQGYPRDFVRRLSVVTASVYATEFALLHGILPAVI